MPGTSPPFQFEPFCWPSGGNSFPGSNPETFNSPLRGLDRAILTPLIGGSTIEGRENNALQAVGRLIKYSDNGSTVSAVNFPQVSLPDHGDISRILHIHRNELGILQQVNLVFSDNRVNIASQYLETRGELGYVVMDLETGNPGDLLRQLKEVPGTIRVRILHRAATVLAPIYYVQWKPEVYLCSITIWPGSNSRRWYSRPV